MQCIINDKLQKNKLFCEQQKVTKPDFPHTPPQYVQLIPFFPTHHMLCTLGSPPLTKLPTSCWLNKRHRFSYSGVKSTLISQLGATCWMPVDPQSVPQLKHWHAEQVAAPASPKVSEAPRPLQGWSKLAIGLKLLRSTANRWKVGLHKACLGNQPKHQSCYTKTVHAL